MNKLIILISFLLFVSLIKGQTEEKVLLNKGVEAFNNKQYTKALDYFNQGYSKNGDYNAALFNAANTAFLNDSLTIAKDLFAEYVSVNENKIAKSKGYYNLGNVQYKEYEKLKANPEKSKESVNSLKASIESYKKALRNNPKDSDARHNLSLAMSKLPPPSENQDQNEGENDENKDGEGENKENKNDENKEGQNNKDGEKGEDGEKGDQKDKGDKGDENKEGDKGESKEDKEGENGDQQKEGQGEKGDQEMKEEEMKGQISRIQATKDLDAMNSDEQKILMKVNRKKGSEKTQNSSSKDW